MGSLLKAASFGPYLYYIPKRNGRSVRAISAQIDGILGFRETGVLSPALQYLERRFGELEIQEASFSLVGKGSPGARILPLQTHRTSLRASRN